MSFYKDGYLIVRGLVDNEHALELGDHLKRRETEGLSSEGDSQAPLSSTFYSDYILSGVQNSLLKTIELKTGIELFKTYNYARIYKKGSILKIHKDRAACEISLTMDLGGDPWSIWVFDRDENPIKIDLTPGDALIYRGCEINHWRSKFNGDEHRQVFIHYVDKYGPYAWAKDDIKKQP